MVMLLDWPPGDDTPFLAMFAHDTSHTPCWVDALGERDVAERSEERPLAFDG